ncbi:hypothetical protein, partial [Heyndrickxia sporothermodurans]|uniref:hypothetical protein n=1 Tax=Heyndrickxia sporothermodurans TaxID=46224 RepID=UPI000A6E83C6
FLLKNPSIKVVYSLFYIKVLTIRAADTGSFYETIKIGNRHNEFKYKVGFTDWTSTEPVYSEKVAFRCKKAYTHRGEVNTETTIWYQMLILNDLDINYIKFRDNPSVHIFSITLEKGDI